MGFFVGVRHGIFGIGFFLDRGIFGVGFFGMSGHLNDWLNCVL